MKFLIASIAFCACVCLSTAGVGYGHGGYAVPLAPAAPINTVVPVYNIPVPAFQPIYSHAVPAYGNIGYGNVAGPAHSSSAAAASASVHDSISNYGAPVASY